MTEINMQSVLAQMRTMAARAEGVQPPAVQNKDSGFSTVMKSAINQVNEVQKASGDMKKAYEIDPDSVSLAEVMIASQKANVAFQTTVQVRNKMVEAYQQVMNMPI